MIRVLFVDDEEMVLRGLKNVLRRRRAEWDMVFACGADAALAEIARAPFDIIISDMRMPGMSGVELLAAVKERAPGIIRIILSGHSENESMAKAFMVAHQFLSKPCDGATLERTIERAARQRRVLTDERLRTIVGGLSSVPMLEREYQRLTTLIGQPTLSAAALAQIVERSPAMCAKLLQIATSDYVGSAARSCDVEGALGVLGLDFARGLLLCSSMFDLMRSDNNAAAIAEVEASCVDAARVGRALAGTRETARDASWAALLQEVGWLVLQHAFPGDSGLRRERSCDEERARYGACHAEVGAYLLGMWGLPLAVVDAVHAHTGQVEPSSDAARCLLEARRVLRAEGRDLPCGPGQGEAAAGVWA